MGCPLWGRTESDTTEVTQQQQQQQPVSVALIANQRDKYLSPSQWSSFYLGGPTKMMAMTNKVVRFCIACYPREN